MARSWRKMSGVWFLAVGVWVLTAVPALCAEHSPGTGPDPAPGQADPEMEEPMGQRLLAQLDLTEAQLAKLKQERTDLHKQMIRDMAEIKILHLDLFGETTQEKPDMPKIEKIIKQISELDGKMMLARVKSVIFLRSQLTPEQKKKMDTLHLRGGFGDMGHSGGKGRHGHKEWNKE